MQIDWFTFGAQVVNFLILVWLLKRFLYGPILKAIDDREQRIAARLQSAAKREEAAEAARQSYENRQAELAHLKETLVSEAAAEVEAWKRKALQEAREEVAAARKTWHDSIAREQHHFLGELRERTAQEVQQVVRHVMASLADQNLELQTVHQFLTYFNQQNEEAWRSARNGQATGDVILRTAFPLTDDDQAPLVEAVQQHVGDKPVRFEVDPQLICGVELVVGDHKLQWNVDHYLQSLEASVAAAIEKRAERLQSA